jgi:hypothetical protein
MHPRAPWNAWERPGQSGNRKERPRPWNPFGTLYCLCMWRFRSRNKNAVRNETWSWLANIKQAPGRCN